MRQFIDFFTNLFHSKNRGLLIYLILNTVFITAIFSGGFSNINGIYVGVLAYLISLMIALSGIGEFFLRVTNGCIPIKKFDNNERIIALFQEVYARASSMDSDLSPKIKLFVSKDDFTNALATGRKTICITRGLTFKSDEEIKGVLAHEFAHIANKDTNMILVIVVGNMIINAVFLILRILVWIFSAFTSNTIIGGIMGLFSLAFSVVIFLLMWIWTSIGNILVSHSSRQKEYLADEFAVRCGYRYGLELFLSSDAANEKLKGIWRTFTSTHPLSIDRINNMRKMLASHR